VELGVTLGVAVGVAVAVAVAVGVAVGVAVAVAVAVAVGVGEGVGVGVGFGGAAQYLPPVFKSVRNECPAQTIISLSAHTAVCERRADGASVVLVAVQVLVAGLYLPPVFWAPGPGSPRPAPDDPFRCRSHTAVW